MPAHTVHVCAHACTRTIDQKCHPKSPPPPVGRRSGNGLCPAGGVTSGPPEPVLCRERGGRTHHALPLRDPQRPRVLSTGRDSPPPEVRTACKTPRPAATSSSSRESHAAIPGLEKPPGLSSLSPEHPRTGLWERSSSPRRPGSRGKLARGLSGADPLLTGRRLPGSGSGIGKAPVSAPCWTRAPQRPALGRCAPFLTPTCQFQPRPPSKASGGCCQAHGHAGQPRVSASSK